MKDYENVMEMIESHLKNLMKLESFIHNIDVNKNIGEVNKVMMNEYMARKETFEANVVH